MADPDEHGADDADDAPADEQPAAPGPTTPPGPYPALLHVQMMTPTAPLAPGAAMRVFPLVHPPGSVPAAWAADPTGRHELRWWNGVEWTDDVADQGEASVDPLP